MAWICGLVAWASSTVRMIWARSVSASTRVTSKRKVPAVLTVPPITSAPFVFSAGTGSPVIMDSSTKDAPSTTCPSTGTCPPGRTRITSPTRTSSRGSSTSPPARTTQAVRGRSFISFRMASLVRPFARASMYLPASTRVMITAADRWGYT